MEAQQALFLVILAATLALFISLVEAFWMLPAHVLVLKPDFARPSRLHAWRTRFTHGLRVKYTRLLLFSLRHAWASLLLLLAAFSLALYAVAGGWIGASLGAKRLQSITLQHLLAAVLVIAGIKLIVT